MSSGPGLRLHPRTRTVSKAERAVQEVCYQLIEREGITGAELWVILCTVGAHFARTNLRLERHPDEPGKGADEA